MSFIRNLSARGLLIAASLVGAQAFGQWAAGPNAFATPGLDPARAIAYSSKPHQKPKAAGAGLVAKSKYDYARTTQILQRLKGKNSRALVNGSVLVLYDSTGPYGYLGDLYSQQMVNLLNHFTTSVTRMPVEQYVAGSMDKQAATFYLGLLYDNPLPASFTSDAMSTTKPLCWLGYNLWKIAWNADYSWNQAFMAKYGMTFYYLDSMGYPTVSYKGQNLTKLQYDPTEGRVEILDATKAKRLATSTRPDGLNIGYITKGANLYYVADNPFSYTTYMTHNDRVLAFEDSIHEVLGTNPGVDHRAIVRVEDVSAIVPPATLTAIADTMASENVPFVVCVIPSYRDPLGYESNGVATSQDITQNPAFINALKYMESKGGQIVMHGLTHQYSNLLNPYNGESADDFEFFRVVTNATGGQQYVGPVVEDSPTWAGGRLDQGIALLKQAGFANVTGWVTPHYMASPVDYVEFQKRFAYSVCRGLTFTQNSLGDLIYVQQHCPWVYTDGFGMKRIPETVGYMDAAAYNGIPPRTAADLVNDAAANTVVRDGFAGMYYHWYLDPSFLKTALQGIKNLGYRFVAPSATLN